MAAAEVGNWMSGAVGQRKAEAALARSNGRTTKWRRGRMIISRSCLRAWDDCDYQGATTNEDACRRVARKAAAGEGRRRRTTNGLAHHACTCAYNYSYDFRQSLSCRLKRRERERFTAGCVVFSTKAEGQQFGRGYFNGQEVDVTDLAS